MMTETEKKHRNMAASSMVMKFEVSGCGSLSA